jgi:hypothetical protein
MKPFPLIAFGAAVCVGGIPHERPSADIGRAALPAQVTVAAGTTIGLRSTPSGFIELVGPWEKKVFHSMGSIALSVKGGGALQIGRLIGDRIDLRADSINVVDVVAGGAVCLHADGLLDIGAKAQIVAPSVDLRGHVISNVGSVFADGAAGGAIDLWAENVMNQGTLAARGLATDGGAVRITYGRFFTESARGSIDASGASRGGRIAIAGQRGSHLFSSGRQTASGARGGEIRLDADDVKLVVATLDASGAGRGGSILVGSRDPGGDPTPATREIVVRPGTALIADGQNDGPGGWIVLASLDRTLFAGRASVRGGIHGGDGGAVEISSDGDLGWRGDVETSAPAGRAGRVLVDPKNITIGDAMAQLSRFELIDPTPNAGDQFGAMTLPLATGNVLVSDYLDDFAGQDAGAMHLFSGRTGALIATVVGSKSGDFRHHGLGEGIDDPRVAVLAGGNYVVAIPQWANGSVTRAGAVMWGSATTGIAGPISPANSLVGSSANDAVGDTVARLTNGNYVVGSSGWDNGSTADVGAATWCDGATGCTGPVSTANSLVGSSLGGITGITALTNSNYVVSATLMPGGAATWCNGTTGRTGVISSDDSLTGPGVGQQILPLANGNYVVSSPYWDNGDGVTEVGAVTWCDGTKGRVGPVSPANSLVGSTSGDRVGTFGAAPLTNGNYVVANILWTDTVEGWTGAVTWGNGTVGTTGVVSAANSLVGTGVGAGGVTPLTNGNYVVNSYLWNGTTNGSVGAVTWGDGSKGTTGVLSAANSLVGSVPGDNIGYDSGASAVTALANGNYVVASCQWNNGAIKTVGAVTWGDGTKGTTGVVSAANSLVGSTGNDQVGSSGVVPLKDGNYVASTIFWSNGSAARAGAVTWGDGTKGTAGVVSGANSLVGSTVDDQVGSPVTPLANGNYVVGSYRWDDGASADVGAATWCDGSKGCAGPISGANSLIGAMANDDTGGVLALPDGNYLVTSGNRDSAGMFHGGAITWADGGVGRVGTVSVPDSFVGADAGNVPGLKVGPVDGTFLASFATTGSGHVYVGVLNFDVIKPTFALAQDQSINIPPRMITAVLEGGQDLSLEASNDITVTAPVTVSAQAASHGHLSLSAGRSISLQANLSTGGGDLTLVSNDRLSSGVVDGQRDPGPGGLIWAAGVAADVGGGAFRAEVRDGAGKTNHQSGSLQLGAISAAHVFAQASGGSLVVEDKVTASGGGDAITLVSDVSFDASSAAADTLTTPGGRFLIYAPDPGTAATGALPLAFVEYDKAYPAAPDPADTGSGIIYGSRISSRDAGTDAGTDTATGDGGSPDADDGGTQTHPNLGSGCGCSALPGEPGGPLSSGLAVFAAWLLARRRRARPR